MTASNESSQPLRLHLAAASSDSPSDSPLDGAWWPYSHDLETELADLVDRFPPDVGRVSRVLFSRPDWETHPRHIPIARGLLKTGSFPSDDTHVVVLKLARQLELKVLVIPAETSEDTAQRLVDQALAPGNHRTATALLARARSASS